MLKFMEKLVQASVAPALMSANTCFAHKVFLSANWEPSSEPREA